MTIDEKLILSKQPIRFISEGIFLRLYNESLYALQTYYQLPLKSTTKYIQKLNLSIVMGGAPAKNILRYFPDIEPTLFGYELKGQFDLSGYPNWYQQQCILTNVSDKRQKPLTLEQLQFLANWRRETASTIEEKQFIQSLKLFLNI